jgi:hypothetical protein
MQNRKICFGLARTDRQTISIFKPSYNPFSFKKGNKHMYAICCKDVELNHKIFVYLFLWKCIPRTTNNWTRLIRVIISMNKESVLRLFYSSKTYDRKSLLPLKPRELELAIYSLNKILNNSLGILLLFYFVYSSVHV